MFSTDWITDVIKQRFDELAEEAEHLTVIEQIEEKLRELEGYFQRILQRENEELFNEYMDLHLAAIVMKMEWIYVRGVQDGMKIISYINKDNGFL